MSMKTYPWDLEERAEDAIVALLKANVGRVAMITAAREVVVAKYPMIRVEAQPSENSNQDSGPNGLRRFNIIVALLTEAVNYNAELRQEELLETARESHRAIKSEVIGCLMGCTSHEELNALGIAGITFSQAHCTTQTRDAGEGKLVTEQTLDVIATPKEI